MIQELLTYPQVDQLRSGEVAEFHQSPDDSVGYIHTQPIGDFLRDWGYALLDRSWNETVYEDELPPVDTQGRYVGLIYPDGAFLVAVDAAGVRQ